MGIKGLWKEIEACAQPTDLSSFKHERLGVDAFAWLHRGAHASATNLALDKPCDNYLKFFERRVQLLLHFKITPVLVFDGRAVPMKDETNTERREKRIKAKEEGKQYLSQGEQEKAAKCFEQSIEITPEMVYSTIQLIKEFYTGSVFCIVSPYESDAQLGYLIRHSYITGVISEDSDLMMYGCQKLISKLDSNGRCVVVRLNDIFNLRGFSAFSPQVMMNINNNTSINNAAAISSSASSSSTLSSLTSSASTLPPSSSSTTAATAATTTTNTDSPSIQHEMLIIIGILSGCDYVNSYPGIGMKKAIKIVEQSLQRVQRQKAAQRQNKLVAALVGSNNNNKNENSSTPSFSMILLMNQTINPVRVLDQCLNIIKENFAVNSEEDFSSYIERVHKSYYCFKHHLVFDYGKQVITPYYKIKTANGIKDLHTEIVGQIWDKATAIKVCEQFKLKARTLEPYNYEGSLYHNCYKLYIVSVRGMNQRSLKEFTKTSSVTSQQLRPQQQQQQHQQTEETLSSLKMKWNAPRQATSTTTSTITTTTAQKRVLTSSHFNNSSQQQTTIDVNTIIQSNTESGKRRQREEEQEQEQQEQEKETNDDELLKVKQQQPMMNEHRNSDQQQQEEQQQPNLVADNNDDDAAIIAVSTTTTDWRSGTVKPRIGLSKKPTPVTTPPVSQVVAPTINQNQQQQEQERHSNDHFKNLLTSLKMATKS